MGAYEKIRDFIEDLDEDRAEISNALDSLCKEFRVSGAKFFSKASYTDLEVFVREKIVAKCSLQDYDSFNEKIEDCVFAGHPDKTNQKLFLGVNFQAAELMAWHFLGKQKPDGCVLSKTCGKKGCVNPYHVFFQSRSERYQINLEKARKARERMK